MDVASDIEKPQTPIYFYKYFSSHLHVDSAKVTVSN